MKNLNDVYHLVRKRSVCHPVAQKLHLRLVSRYNNDRIFWALKMALDVLHMGMKKTSSASIYIIYRCWDNTDNTCQICQQSKKRRL